MANIAIPDNPKFKPEIEETTEETPGSYEEFNARFARLLENETFLRNTIGREILQQTLPTGQTTITLTAQNLNDNSSINVYASIPGVEYTSITVSGNNITITFDEQEEDVYITVIISDVMV